MLNDIRKLKRLVYTAEAVAAMSKYILTYDNERRLKTAHRGR